MEQQMEYIQGDMDEYAEEAQFASPSGKSKSKKMKRAATAKSTKKMTATVSMKVSDSIERDYGLTEDKIKIESLMAQLEAAKQRCAVMDSLEEENKMLRGQVARAEEIREEQVRQLDESHQANLKLTQVITK